MPMESNPFWLNNAQYQEFCSTEELPARSDVVVIGGGITGMSTAYWLSKFGIEVTLLEQRGIASGASGRNGGHIVANTIEYYSRTVENHGEAKAAEFFTFNLQTIEAIRQFVVEHNVDCQLKLDGHLTLASTENELKEIKETIQALHKAGFPSDFWDKERVTRELGADCFWGAQYSPDGGMLHPARLVWGITEAALDQGTLIYTGTEATGVQTNADGGLTVETSKGHLTTEIVVYATNAYTPLLHDFFKEKISPVRGQVLVTEPVEPLFPYVCGANFGFEYWLQDEEGHIILGGWRWSQKEMEVGLYDDTIIVEEIHQGLYQFLTNNWPALKGIRVEQAWTGIMGFSQDGWPIVGTLPGRGDQFVAAGFTGHGMPVCFLAGKAIAEIINSGRTSIPIGSFSPRRFL
ncbi:MAG: NAD(P)/FAD-dependent oxidoreductase [Anaerolineae bacterium]